MFRARPWVPGLVAASLLVLGVHQAVAADEIQPLSGYAITSWTEVDGRPFGAVQAVVQDPSRMLWIASNAGVLRFDGARFSPWNAIAETPLPDVPATALYLREDGSLWVGLSDGAGLYELARRHAVQQDPMHLLPGAVTSIAEDREATLWVVADSTLYHREDGRWVGVALSDPPQTRVRVTSASRGRDGGLLVTTTVGLFAHEAGRRFHKVAPGWAWAVDTAADGSLWVTDTVTGFRRVDERRTPRTGFGRNGFRLLHDRLGGLWVASIGEGLLRVTKLESGHPAVERATLHTGSLTDSVQSLVEDREGNVWAGSSIGLHRLTRQKLTSMPNIGLVTTAAAADGGDLWAGTNYGLVRFQPVNGAWRPVRLTGPTVYVTDIVRRHDGTLWMGAREGLLRLSANRFSFVTLPAPADRLVIRSIAADDGDGLWIGDGQRLLHWAGGRVEPFERPTAGDARVAFAMRDSHGRLWTPFLDGAVGVLEADGTFRELTASQLGTEGGRVYAVLEDADHATMWFGTSDGLRRLRDGQVAAIGGNRLPGKAVWTLVQDAEGSVWADLDWGVIRFTRDAFEKARGGGLFDYRLFDPDDGLAGAPVTTMRSGRTADGTLWFVRGGALTTVNPTVLDHTPVTPPEPLRIEVSTDAGSLSDASATTLLPSKLHRLDIAYSTVALTHPNRLRFRYHLEGFDTSWTDAGSRRTVSYTNLPPGRYTFRVEAETNEGAWRASTPWTFTVAPRFYQTLWFQAACGLALLLGGWAAWHVRLRVEQERHASVLAERARLSREIHDSLLQGMVGMTLRLDHLAHDTPELSPTLRGALIDLRRQLEYYLRDARRSIRNLRSPLLETHDVASALRELGTRATADSSIVFRLGTVGGARRYSAQIENEAMRIGQEAIANAIRHARARNVRVTVAFEPHQLTVEVEDDGCGMAPAPDPDDEGHFGIVAMRERAESLGGRLIVGTPGTGGTRVQAVIPA